MAKISATYRYGGGRGPAGVSPNIAMLFFQKDLSRDTGGGCLLDGNTPQSSILRPPIVDETLLTVMIHHDWEKNKIVPNSGQIIESNSDHVESPLVTVTMLRKMLIIMSLFSCPGQLNR